LAWLTAVVLVIGIAVVGMWREQKRADNHVATCQTSYRSADAASAAMRNSYVRYIARPTDPSFSAYAQAGEKWAALITDDDGGCFDSTEQSAAHDYFVVVNGCTQQVDSGVTCTLPGLPPFASQRWQSEGSRG
jgi:hypothetical protein